MQNKGETDMNNNIFLDLKRLLFYKNSHMDNEFNNYLNFIYKFYPLNFCYAYDDEYCACDFDEDFDELCRNSDIVTNYTYNETIEYDNDTYSIINHNEGEKIGYINLIQNGVTYTCDIIVADNGCVLSEQCVLKSIHVY